MQNNNKMIYFYFVESREQTLKLLCFHDLYNKNIILVAVKYKSISNNNQTLKVKMLRTVYK